jgi:hypothetical protein
VTCDGYQALVWDTVTGRLIGTGITAIPSKAEALKAFDPKSVIKLPPGRIKRQQLIFRSYDSMNVNRG